VLVMMVVLVVLMGVVLVVGGRRGERIYLTCHVTAAT
jgi:uncharacterized membrane protein